MSVLVGIPALDGTVCCETLAGIFGSAARISDIYQCVQCSDIRLARTQIADYFWHHPHFEVLWWIDSDIGFTAADAAYLFEGDEELACATYARKRPGAPPVEYGLGFARVSRDAIGRMRARRLGRGAFEVNDQALIDVFPSGIVEGRWLTEDRGFFALARECGLRVRLEHRCKLLHIGRCEYAA